MTEVISVAEVPAFDASKKKKKKKTPKFEDEIDVNEKEEEAPKKDEEPAEENTEEVPTDFDFGAKKKKKSSKKKAEDEEDAAEAGTSEDTPVTAENGEEKPQGIPWAGSDRDYSYEELAGRVYNLMHNNNPELGSKQKIQKLKPPQVCREGTKKTVWLNFAEMCPILKRKPEHLLNYVLAELGTNGSLDGKLRLVIKGRFQPKQIENVLRHYITEYVACRTCKSADTVLKKENRLYFVCCDSCGSTRSVAAIKKGFEAQVGKRKKEEK